MMRKDLEMFFSVLLLLATFATQVASKPLCPLCPPGQGPSGPCDSALETKCSVCPDGTFSSRTDNEHCELCSKCDTGLYELRPCNKTNDVFCELCSWPESPKDNVDYQKKCVEVPHYDKNERGYHWRFAWIDKQPELPPLPSDADDYVPRKLEAPPIGDLSFLIEKDPKELGSTTEKPAGESDAELNGTRSNESANSTTQVNDPKDHNLAPVDGPVALPLIQEDTRTKHEEKSQMEHADEKPEKLQADRPASVHEKEKQKADPPVEHDYDAKGDKGSWTKIEKPQADSSVVSDGKHVQRDSSIGNSEKKKPADTDVQGKDVRIPEENIVKETQHDHALVPRETKHAQDEEQADGPVLTDEDETQEKVKEEHFTEKNKEPKTNAGQSNAKEHSPMVGTQNQTVVKESPEKDTPEDVTEEIPAEQSTQNDSLGQPGAAEKLQADEPADSGHTADGHNMKETQELDERMRTNDEPSMGEIHHSGNKMTVAEEQESAESIWASVPTLALVLTILTSGFIFFFIGFFYKRESRVYRQEPLKQWEEPEVTVRRPKPINRQPTTTPPPIVRVTTQEDEEDESEVLLQNSTDTAELVQWVNQSPVDIISQDVQLDLSLNEKPLQFYYVPENSKYITNTGATVKLVVDYHGSRLTGGPLGDTNYCLDHIHFHWGDTIDRGSEHSLDGRKFPAECHFVHWNEELYSCLEEAAVSDDGLAVLAVFLQVDGKMMSDHLGLHVITRCLCALRYKWQKVPIPSQRFDPATLLPANQEDYWTYKGSLTIPPYYENVTWIIFRQPINISNSQIERFRQLYKHEEGMSDQQRLVNNYRGPQPLGDRHIRANFNPGSKESFN